MLCGRTNRNSKLSGVIEEPAIVDISNSMKPCPVCSTYQFGPVKGDHLGEGSNCVSHQTPEDKRMDPVPLGLIKHLDPLSGDSGVGANSRYALLRSRTFVAVSNNERRLAQTHSCQLRMATTRLMYTLLHCDN